MRNPRGGGADPSTEGRRVRPFVIALVALVGLGTTAWAGTEDPSGTDAPVVAKVAPEDTATDGDAPEVTETEPSWLETPVPVEGPQLILSPFLQSLRLGAQLRIRGEARDPADYRKVGNPDRTSDFLLLRTRIDMEATVNDHLGGFIQIQDSRQFGQDPTLMPIGANSVLSDVEGTDLHQGFITVRDIGDLPFGTEIQAGRFAMSYGDERLISPLDWDNVGRAWDGVRARITTELYSADFFGTVIKEADPVGSMDDDQGFYGMYLSHDGEDGLEADGYWFFRNLKSGPKAADAEDSTLGLRAAYGDKKNTPFRTTAEIAWQHGDRFSTDLEAWAFAYTFDWLFGTDWNVGSGFEYTFASGDDNAGDKYVKTFDPLFPFGHQYQGWMDLVGWRNSHDFAGKVYASPIPGWTFGSNLHYFKLDQNEDAWYAANGTVMRPGNATADTDLGWEIDVYAMTKIYEYLSLMMGYSHFFPGAFVRKTGSDMGMDWVFAMATLNI